MPFRNLDSRTDRRGSPRLLRLLLAVSVTLPLVLFAGIGWRERWEAQEEAERNSRKNALILHEHVLKVFDTVAQALDRVDERIHGRSWREIAESESPHRYLRTLEGELEQIGAIGLTDPDGIVRNSSLVFPSRKTYVGNRADFREQREQDSGLLIAGPLADPATGKPSFGISRRRSGPGGPDGSFDGMIAAIVDPDYFSSFYRQVIGDEGESISLVREDGAMLMPGGGRIRIAASPGPEPRTARIAVSDNGAGMPPEVVPSIPSSPPRASARGRGSGCRWSTASPVSRAASPPSTAGPAMAPASASTCR